MDVPEVRAGIRLWVWKALSDLSFFVPDACGQRYPLHLAVVLLLTWKQSVA